jgi:hypothetical protein
MKRKTLARVLALGMVPAALGATAAAGSASTAQPKAPTVTLRDAAGQYVQVNARGQVSVGRQAARFTKVAERGGRYELKYGSGRNAKYLTVSSFGASLGRNGTQFAPGQASRQFRGYTTIDVGRYLLTANGSRLTEAAQGRHGPTVNQEWK